MNFWLVVLLSTLTAVFSAGGGPPVRGQEQGSADGVWHRVELRPGLPAAATIDGPAAIHRFDRAAFEAVVSRAAREGTAGVPPVVQLPMPDGSFARFSVAESPILAPELQRDFPEIRTWAAQGIDDATATARFGWTSAGFHAMVIGAAGTVRTDPYVEGSDLYVSFFKRDAHPHPDGYRCALDEGSSAARAPRGLHAFPISNGETLRTYRLAIAATAEYTAAAGGTKTQALARIVTTTNRVNLIYQRELAVRLIVRTGTASDSTSLIFTNASTDGYTNDNGDALLDENQAKLSALLGAANYDVGHVFGTGGGGKAALAVVCGAGKARGVTGLSDPVGDKFDVDFVAHEIGHQFGGNHTFNGGDSHCGGNRNATTAYEPGSGSTIQAYAGTCGAENLQLNSSDYFHVGSLNEMTAFITNGGGVCAQVSSTGNTPPVVTAGTTHTIPANTPFALTASGSDADGNSLTYTWEQYDLGTGTSGTAGMATDDGSRPLFRSYPPSSSPTRIFPRLDYILDNANTPPQIYACGAKTCATGEALPTTNRSLSFHVTARDSRSGGGGIHTSSAQVTVTTAAGPFRVTSPNTAVNWAPGSTQTVTWTVANTTASPVNASAVKISVSLDGGQTFPVVLAASTPNDGSQVVTLPSQGSAKARIKIEAVGNIFFDVSDADFWMGGPSAGVTVSTHAGGTRGYLDGSGTAARFNRPEGIAIDSSGTMYIADTLNDRIRRVDPFGAVTTLAPPPFTPRGIAVDQFFNVYVSLYNHTIWRVSSAGLTSVVAGNGSFSAGPGFADGVGTNARFSTPYGLAIDSQGVIYVADTGNHRIRKIGSGGVVSTLAGSTQGDADGQGAGAQFNSPMALAIDASGNLFVTDVNGIRRVTAAGAVTTVVPRSALNVLVTPRGLAVDRIGNLFVSDQARVLRVSPDGIVTTLAGGETTGFADGTAETARFDEVEGIVLGNPGTLYALDRLNNRVRRISGITTTFVVSPSSWNAPAAGGSQVLTIGSSAPASWTATTSATWLTLSASSGTGTSVTLTAQPNDTAAARAAVATVAGRTVTVTQAAPDSTFTLSPTTWTAPADGGTQVISVTSSSSGAMWMATSSASWLTVSASSGTGSGAIVLTAGANLDAARTATATIAGRTVSVTQAGNSTPPALLVSTVAGGAAGFAEGAGAAARFNLPTGMAVDANDNLYVADFYNHRIRKISPGGDVSTLAGSGAGFADGGPGAGKFEGPVGVAVDAGGTVYVADTFNHRIRKVTAGGVVSTIAGGGEGFADGAGTAARFAYPHGIAVDGSGNVYVADTSNDRIRKITPAGTVSTLAGGTYGFADGAGTAARFARPRSLAIDSAGLIYVSDHDNQRIRLVTTAGVVTTLAGGTEGAADGTGAAAQFKNPFGIAVNSSGVVFVADLNNHRIRRITPSGVVTTVAGSTAGFADGLGPAGAFNWPGAVGIDSHGNVFVADRENNRIRRLSRFDVSPRAWSAPAGGGTQAVAISAAAAGTTWTAATTESWLTAATASGTGTAVTLSASANGSGATRTANAIIGGQLVAVTQPALATVLPGKTSLRFAATRGADSLLAATPEQTVTLTQSGGSPIQWTATADQPWLYASPAAATGTGLLNVGVRYTSALPSSGAVTAKLTVRTSDGSRTLAAIDVTLTLQAPAALTAPIGQVDTPAQNASNIVGATAVTGWAIDDMGVRHVRIYRNCLTWEDQRNCQSVLGHYVVYIGDAAFVSGARPDVEALFPNNPQAYRAGWGYLLMTSMLPHVPGQQPNGGQGTITLYAFATDVDGKVTLLGRSRADTTPTAISLANDTIAKPFGAIDTPGQGETVSGLLSNFGWALTPDSNTTAGVGDILIPTNGSTMYVFIDGAPVSTVAYNQCRGTVGNPVPSGNYCNDDVSNVFGNPAPLPVFTTRTSNPTRHRNLDAGRAPIGSFQIDTRTLANGPHSIAWSVTDSAGRTEGIGSRFFNVLNGSARPASAGRAVADAPALPADLAPGRVDGRSGFDLTVPWQEIAADANGDRTVRINELGRLELRLPTEISSGYLRIGNDLRPLPAGSRLADGSFTWAPPAGYLGRYDLVFVGTSAQLPIAVTVAQGTGASEGTIAAAIDLPSSSVSGPFTVAGWALDRQALSGAGIGAVHVWAFRKGADPLFLGAAPVGGERPDVAAEYGAQFARSGWSLTAPTLADGEYQLVAYFWSARTGRFEDARARQVVVR